MAFKNKEDAILDLWPKFLDWLNEYVDPEKLVSEGAEKVDCKESHFRVSHPGLNVRAGGNEYEIFIMVDIHVERVPEIIGKK